MIISRMPRILGLLFPFIWISSAYADVPYTCRGAYVATVLAAIVNDCKPFNMRLTAKGKATQLAAVKNMLLPGCKEAAMAEFIATRDHVTKTARASNLDPIELWCTSASVTFAWLQENLVEEIETKVIEATTPSPEDGSLLNLPMPKFDKLVGVWISHWLAPSRIVIFDRDGKYFMENQWKLNDEWIKSEKELVRKKRGKDAIYRLKDPVEADVEDDLYWVVTAAGNWEQHAEGKIDEISMPAKH